MTNNLFYFVTEKLNLHRFPTTFNMLNMCFNYLNNIKKNYRLKYLKYRRTTNIFDFLIFCWHRIKNVDFLF